MATSIVSPSGINTQAIDQAFGNIYNMFGNSGSGGGSSTTPNLFGTNITTPSTMSVNNPNNTGMYSQATSAMGTGGTALMGEGGNLVNTGMGVTGGGLQMSQGAYDTTGQALATLDPALSYYNLLAGADPATVASAAAPYADTIQKQLTQAMTQNDQGSPAGGYSFMTKASLPTAAANQITATELANQQAAMQALQSLAGTQNTIAGTAGGIGSGVAGTGQGIAGTGTTLTSQGLTAEQAAEQAAMAKLGFNAQTGALSTFGAITGGLANLGEAASGVSGFKLPSGCWIAEAIYGTNDPRTLLVRAYLNGPFKQTAFGRAVMSLYQRYGRAIAAQVRKHGWLKRALQPLFDKALDHAAPWWRFQWKLT